VPDLDKANSTVALRDDLSSMTIDVMIILAILDADRLPDPDACARAGLIVALVPDVIDKDEFDAVMQLSPIAGSSLSFAHAEWGSPFKQQPVSSLESLWTAFGAVHPDDAVGSNGFCAIFQPGADSDHFQFAAPRFGFRANSELIESQGIPKLLRS
jgi:hypothetical protein